MKMTKNSKISNQVLKKLYSINTNKLVIVKEYSNNSILLHTLVNQYNLSDCFFEIQSNDILRLQQIIKSKNKIIKQYAKKMEELNETGNTNNVQRAK